MRVQFGGYFTFQFWFRSCDFEACNNEPVGNKVVILCFCMSIGMYVFNYKSE